jgi:hypothetical protein
MIGQGRLVGEPDPEVDAVPGELPGAAAEARHHAERLELKHGGLEGLVGAADHAYQQAL